MDRAELDGLNRSLLEYLKSLPQKITKYQITAFENCYNQLIANSLVVTAKKKTAERL